MAAYPPRFLHFAGGASLSALVNAARAALPGVSGHGFEHDTRLLDGPDLALRRRGWLLQWRVRDGAGELALRRLADGVGLEAGAPACPAAVHEIAAPRLQARLETLLGDAPLVSLERWLGHGWTAPCLNADGKIECELSLVEFHLPEHARTSVVVGELRPKRGYEKETSEWATRLTAVLPWRRLGQDYVLMLTDLHRAALAERGVGARLERSAPARPAVAAVLLQHLAVVVAIAPPGCAPPGAEPLHDLRVAVRRTRSLLRGHRKLLGGDLVTHFAREFRWLARATGLLRDLDVLGEALSTPSADFTTLTAADRARLATFVATQRAAEAVALQWLLESRRYAQLLRDWPVALAAAARPRAGRSQVTLDEAVARAVRRALTRLRRDALALQANYTPADLHELRKRGKRLRYLVEPFSGLYARARISAALADLKRLQTMMGEICDRHAQLELLGRTLARRARGDRALGAALKHARAALRSCTARDDIAAVLDALARFDDRRHQAAFAALFGAAP